DLHNVPPQPEALELIPRELALEYGMLPVRVDGNRLFVAVRDPFDIKIDEAIRKATSLQVVTVLSPESQLRQSLHQYYGLNSYEELAAPAGEARVEIELEKVEQIPIEKLLAAGESFSTIQVVNTLIADAVRRHASDLHIRPEDGGIRVRYRVDGEM